MILCGYGRFGRAVAGELQRNGAAMVVIDADPDREEEIRQLGVPYVIGSALSDEVLERAGIRRARAIVIATPSDPDNVFITLSAREKNPTIRIHARGETEGGLRRLELAGAHQALSAYHSGGVRMAASILRPSIVDFLELSMPGHHEETALEEMRLGARCGSKAAPSRTSSGNGTGCASWPSSARARRSRSCPNRRRRWHRMIS